MSITCTFFFDKSDTIAERKEKAVQSHSIRTKDNWFLGQVQSLSLLFEYTPKLDQIPELEYKIQKILQKSQNKSISSQHYYFLIESKLQWLLDAVGSFPRYTL
jgi:hypothetical protein